MKMNRSFSVNSSYVKENTEKNRSFSVDSSLFSGTYVKENRYVPEFTKENTIIDLEVILQNGIIEIHPVIVPEDILFDYSFNGYGRIIDLDVIFNHLSSPIRHPVIVLRKTIDNYLLATKKRKLSLEQLPQMNSHYSIVSPISEISPKIINIQGFEHNMTQNIINFIRNYDFGDNLYVKLNDLYPNFNKYIDYYYQINKLHVELKYINDNVLPYYGIVMDDLNPYINIYIVKYTVNINDSKKVIEDKLTRTYRLIIFCERTIKWISYCLDNKIKKDKQHTFFSLKKDYWNQYFLKDTNTRDYWKQVNLKIPLDYLYDKLKDSKIEIIFHNKTNFYIKSSNS